MSATDLCCPCCGTGLDLAVLLSHSADQQAFERLVGVSVPLGARVLQYINLHTPEKQRLTLAKKTKLLLQLLPDLERKAIARSGRDWPAPLALWAQAIDQMLSQRDTLALPLKGHGYLYAVLQSLANKQEAAAEAQALAQQRSPARSGGHTVTVRGEPMGIGQALEAVYGGTNTAMPQQAQGKKATPPNEATREKIAAILGKKPAPAAPTPATPPTPNSERPAP